MELPSPDTDGDGSSDDLDCVDDDATIFPGAPDLCGDRLTTDCDRTSDDGLVTVDGGASFTDLQQALDAASSGSEVLVCPGTYAGPFQASLAVNLVSLDGAEVTELNGRQGGTVLGLPGGSTLTGFTLRDGLTPNAGGGLLQTAPGALVITDCTIQHNRAGVGGGIAVDVDSVVTIVGSVIRANDGVDGGGLWVGAGSTVDLGTSVVETNAAESGGGVFLDGASLIGGQLLDNRTTGWLGGGGLATLGSNDVVGTEIAGNHGYSGAGFDARSGALNLTDVRVHDNDASFVMALGDGYGGGGYVYQVDLVLAGTTEITGNTSGGEGGGLFVQDGTLTGGRITGNTAYTGGGVALYNGAEMTDTAVEGNHANGQLGVGGGVYIFFGGTIHGGTVVGNTVGILYGGGIAVWNSFVQSALLDGVVVTDNRAPVSGGGLYVYSSMVEIAGSSVLRNLSAEGGGATIADGSLTSVGSDWGVDGDDNGPDDVFAGTTVAGYGAGASFVCTVGCAPVP